MLRVRVFAADDGGCGYYRMIWPGEAVNAERDRWNIEVQVIRHDDPSAQIYAKVQDQEVMYLGKRMTVPQVVGLDDVPQCDIIVFQRPLRKEMVDLIPWLQYHGIAVVVEIDDDFTHMSPKNVAWTPSHPLGNPTRNHRWLAKACRLADLVTCTTPALARQYQHGRVAVLPNYVPRHYLDVPMREAADPVICWSGSVMTHPDDLQVVGTAVRRVVERTGARIRIVGTGKYVARRLGVEEGWLEPTDWVGFHEYPAAMAQASIGIVPLELTLFNHAKSALKGLEFASVGVPFVASPTEPYLDLGIGATARRPKDWYSMLMMLINLPDPRAHATALREYVAEHMTIEQHANLWAAAWTEAKLHHMRRPHVRPAGHHGGRGERAALSALSMPGVAPESTDVGSATVDSEVGGGLHEMWVEGSRG